LLLLSSGIAAVVSADLTSAVEVKTVRVRLASALNAKEDVVTLDTTGYIVTAHKIEVASRVAGRVAWIGVQKGEHVKQGQELARLEDDEYRARVTEAQGALGMLKARLLQLQNGSRPEEVAKANADLARVQADLDNAKISLNRTRLLVKDGIQSQQVLDDAEARYNAQAARVASYQKAYELVRLGPREEEKAALQSQIKQAEGTLQFAQIQLENTIIRAPVAGTVLERNVERGEFVTNNFVGERGAKGYVVTLADLNELEVELDITHDDFTKLKPRQQAIITTEAYPDREHRGVVAEISPEANREKAAVPVRVRVLNPGGFLRPEMHANVVFFTRRNAEQVGAEPLPTIPASAVRDGAVFVVFAGKAVRRKVRTGSTTRQGIQIKEGLSEGEEVIVNPPAKLQDGQKVVVQGEKKQ
jgi:HlyD family secretion protein